MKNLSFIIVACLLVFACETKEEQRYTQSSEEINTVKAVYDAYLDGDWEGMKKHYAPNAKIHHNSPRNKPATIDEMITMERSNVQGLSNYTIDKGAAIVEMVKDDNNEIWVNYWSTWKGTLASTNQTFEIPIHSTFQFKDGKIIEEHGYWNNTEIAMASMGIENPANQMTGAEMTTAATVSSTTNKPAKP